MICSGICGSGGVGGRRGKVMCVGMVLYGEFRSGWSDGSAVSSAGSVGVSAIDVRLDTALRAGMSLYCPSCSGARQSESFWNAVHSLSVFAIKFGGSCGCLLFVVAAMRVALRRNREVIRDRVGGGGLKRFMCSVSLVRRMSRLAFPRGVFASKQVMTP